VSCEHPRPLALARKLSDAHGCDVVIPLGRCGMVCAESAGATWHLPATPTEVRAVCGAGDTVFAALAVGMTTGKSLREACRAAMGAAGRQVANVGIATVGVPQPNAWYGPHATWCGALRGDRPGYSIRRGT
jgi:bifunctional ADP-heptose synthase (sugar kinase/adenylyltransferase)